jgi:N6-adenosine-specific RNA methylase IME4
MKIDVSKIIVKDDRRGINTGKVKELAESIKQIGLINPITITKNNVLIAGLHRLEAHKLLQLVEIECSKIDLEGLYAELIEIDENLIRNELHYIDRGNQLSRRKQIYEELFPKTISVNKRGGPGRGNKTNADSAVVLEKSSFVEDASVKTGKSTRVIHEDLQISKDMLPEVKQIVKDKNINKADALKIARLEPEQQKKIAQKFTNDNAKSLVDANRLIKKEEVHETPILNGKYRVICADPPWNYGNKLVEGYGAAENHYPSMTIKELCELPVKELAEDNAVLFLWVTSPLLEECFEVIKAWGFKYKTSFVWDKIKHNMGHYNSVRHELLLVCTRGSCLPDNKKLFDSVVSIERSDKHSEKPEEFREIINTLYQHGNKIELFSRKQVNGWDVWGNQT